MHYTAMKHGHLFFKTYFDTVERPRVLDIGSQDVNGSLRQVAPKHADYIGADFTNGNGVDILLNDPYLLPFEDASFDAVVSSSVFEHSEMFWLVFLEALRVLKPDGLLYLNVPSNGSYHRYPVDCWRFYPDSGAALETWGRRSGYEVKMLESFVGPQENDGWNDLVAVFLKDDAHQEKYSHRIIDHYHNFTNGRRDGSEQIIHQTSSTEDQRNRSLTKRLSLKRGKRVKFDLQRDN